MGRPKAVIVGAGFGGLNAAFGLARLPLDVTVLDRTNHHTFQPLLYQVATAALSPGDIASPIRAVLRRYPNVRVLLGEAVSVDLPGRRVRLRDGDLPYDYLVLAPGARHAYFGHDAWEAWAPGLKTLEDALEMRRRILLAFERAERAPDEASRRANLTFVVVGAGPTGVELAGAIAEIARHTIDRDFRAIDPRSARVVLVEAGPRVLPSFAPALSDAAALSLKRLGVEVRTGVAVTDVGPDHVTLGGEVLPARTALWAAGVTASPLGRTLGAPVDRAGRVQVGPTLALPEHQEVFVIGDLATCAGPHGKPLPGVAPVAIQQGRAAARNIARALEGQPALPFQYVDRGSMATIGRAAAVFERGGLKMQGFVAWLGWLLVHIVSLIGFRNRLLVLVNWTWSYLSYRRGVRLITETAPPKVKDAP